MKVTIERGNTKETIEKPGISALIQDLDTDTRITAITLIASEPDEEAYFKEWKKAIIARNLLINNFQIAKDGDPFLEVMQYYHDFWRGKNSYNITDYRLDLAISIEKHKQTGFILPRSITDLGIFGLKAYIQNLMQRRQKEPLDQFRVENFITGNRLLQAFIEAQALENAPFPFAMLTLKFNGNKGEQWSNLEENLFIFLKQNPELIQVELIFDPQAFKITGIERIALLERFKREKIATNLRFENYGNTLLDDFNRQIESQVLIMKRELQTSALKKPLPASKTLSEKAVPDAWHKPRKRQQTTRKIKQEISTDFTVDRQLSQQQQHIQADALQKQQQITQAIANRQNAKQNLKDYSEYYLEDSELLDANNSFSKIYWRQWIGERDPGTLTHFTRTAFEFLSNNSFYFKNGLNLDNLPSGLFMHNQDGKKILCFNSKCLNENHNALTQKITQKTNLVIFGSVSQLSDKESDNMALASTFKAYCNSRNNDTLKEIFQSLPEGSASWARLAANPQLFDIFMRLEHGHNFYRMILAKGPLFIEKFVQTLLKLKDNQLLDWTLRYILGEDFNNNSCMDELFTDKGLALLECLSSFSMNQAIWWRSLCDQIHGLHNFSWSFQALVEGFQYFVKEIEKSGLSLPAKCEILDAGNLLDSLDRLLAILKASINPKAQLNHLAGISLKRENAPFAISEGFYFVSAEMELVSDKANPEEKLSYRLDQKTLFSHAKDNSSFNDFKKYFFRYIGLQAYTYDYLFYLELFTKIEALPLDDRMKKQWATLVATATVGNTIFCLQPQTLISRLNPEFISADIMDELFNLCAFITPFQMHLLDLEGLIKYTQVTALPAPPITVQDLKLLAALGHNPSAIGRFLDMQNGLTNSQCLALANTTIAYGQEITLFFEAMRELEKRAYPPLADLLQRYVDIMPPGRNPILPSVEQLIAVLEQMQTPSAFEMKQLLSQQLPGLEFWNLEEQILESFDAGQIAETLIDHPDLNELFQGLDKHNPDFQQIIREVQNLQDPSLEPVVLTVFQQFLSLKIEPLLDNSTRLFYQEFKDFFLAYPGSLDGDGNFLKRFTALDKYIQTLATVSDKNPRFRQALIQQFHGLLAVLNKIDLTVFSDILNTKNLSDQQKLDLAALIQKNPDPQNAQTLLSALSEIPAQLLVTFPEKDSMLETCLSHIYFIQHAYSLSGLKALNVETCNLIHNFATVAQENPVSARILLKLLDRLENNLSNNERIGLLKTGLKILKDQRFDLSLGSTIKTLHHWFSDPIKRETLMQSTSGIYFPTIQDLEQAEDANALQAWIHEKEKDPFKGRIDIKTGKPLPGRNIAEQFTLRNVLEKITKIKLCFETKGVNIEQSLLDSLTRKTLWKQYKKVVSYGLQYNGKSLLEKQQILKQLIVAQGQERNPKQLVAIRLQLIALFRELYYLNSADQNVVWPNEMQIIALLLIEEHGGSIMLDVKTGEGKSCLSALKLAMLWSKGHTVHNITSNHTLAQRDFEAMQPFFNSIGACSAVITDKSRREDHQSGGIHFSTAADSSLFRQRMSLAGTPIDKKNEIFDLVIDEADQTFFDDTTQYVVSENDKKNAGEDNPDAWIYPLVNDFVDYLDNKLDPQSEKWAQYHALFQSVKDQRPQATIKQEVFILLGFLKDQAAANDKDARRLHGKTFHLTLNRWIESAIKARNIYDDQQSSQEEEKYFIDRNHIVNGKRYSFAKIVEGGLIKEGAVWERGIHQLLHARLQAQEGEDALLPAFYCEFENKTCSLSNNHEFLNFYRDKKGVTCGFSGSSGSGSENRWLRRRFHMDTYALPTQLEVNRDIAAPFMAVDEQEQIDKILALMKKNKGAAFLIFCKNTAMIQRFQAVFNQKQLQVQILSAEEALDQLKMDNIINQGGKPGQLTMTTFAERGIDIKPKPGSKLVVIDTNLTTLRRKIQKQGRTSRQGRAGIYYEVYNKAEIEAEYGLVLSKNQQTMEKQLAQIQISKDQSTKRSADEDQPFLHLMTYVQRYFDKVDKFLRASGSYPDSQQSFKNYRKDILESLKDLREDCQDAFPDGPEAYNHFKAGLEKVLASIYEDWQTMESASDDDKGKGKEKEARLNPPDLAFFLAATKRKQPHGLQGEFRFKQLFNLEKLNQVKLNLFAIIRSSTSRLDLERFNRFKLQATNQQDLVSEWAQLAEQACKNYLQLSPGKDRKALINRFLEISAQKASPTPEGYQTELNTVLIDALQQDVQINQSFFGLNRPCRSRCRAMIWSLKTLLFTLHAPQNYAACLEEELHFIAAFCQVEKSRSFYKQSGLLPLMDRLIQSLHEKPANLIQIRLHLNAMLKSKKFDDNASSLREMSNYLDCISTYAIRNAAALNDNPETRLATRNMKIFQKLRKFTSEAAPSAPGRLGHFFRDYTQPPVVPSAYAAIIKPYTDLREQYYAARLVVGLDRYLSQNLKAFNLSCIAQEKGHFKVIFTLLDESDLPSTLSMDFKLDFDEKKLIIQEVDDNFAPFTPIIVQGR